MALNNDYDDLMADIEWEDSEIDSGYFNEDDQAGTPMDSWPLSPTVNFPFLLYKYNFVRILSTF